MTAPDIAQHRLSNQHLIGPPLAKPEDVVQLLGAVQAQDYAGSKWGVAQRLNAAVEADLDGAYNDGRILRTHVMRPTWHFVMPQDIRWLLKLTAPRVHALMAYYNRQMELDSPTLLRANQALTAALEGGNQLTRAEATRVYATVGVSGSGQRIGHLLAWAELEGLICSGAMKGKQHTYALLEERVPAMPTLDREASLAELTRRYFSGHGPAQVQDFAWWSGLSVADARASIALAHEDLVSEVIDGKTYWSLPPVAVASFKPPLVHLLPNYDEYFIAYKDRGDAFDRSLDVSRQVLYDVLYRHVIVLDGRIVGGWRPTLVKKEIQIEARLLVDLSAAELAALDTAAQAYSRFRGLPVALTSRRYDS